MWSDRQGNISGQGPMMRGEVPHRLAARASSEKQATRKSLREAMHESGSDSSFLPPKPAAYQHRMRRSGLPGAANAEMVEALEEMRQMLSTLSASGTPMPSGRDWTHESAATHFGMSWQHLCRALHVSISGWRRHGPPPDSTDLNQLEETSVGVPVLTDAEGVPDERTLGRLGLIMPVGTWKEKWDLMILFLIIYAAIMVPIRVCFDHDATGLLLCLELFMSCAFLLDMYFTFNTVYFDPDTGSWVVNRADIARAYLKRWFWIDAPSSVPVELLDLFLWTESESPRGLALLRFLRMFRLLRLLRLVKIDEYVETLENHFQVNLRFINVVSIFVRICFLSHMLGCFWYGVHGISRESSPTTWAQEYDDGRPADPATPLSLRYLYSVYWAVTTLTTVGYGDLVPTNKAEHVYALVAMLCSSMVFGYLISKIGFLIASVDRQASLIEAKLDAVKEYVVFRQLPIDLASRVRKHYKYYYTRRAAFDEVDLLGGLPPSLRAEVTKYVLNETLGKLPLFSTQLDPEFQLEVFPMIKPVSYSKGEIVFKRGETSRELIFLLAGEIAVYSPLDGRLLSKITPTEEILFSAPVSPTSKPEPTMRLKHAGAFGEAVLTGVRRSATHIAHSWSEVLVLTKPDLTTLFSRNPRAARRIITSLLGEMDRKHRLQMLMMRFVICSLQPGTEVRAAMVIQKAWKGFVYETDEAEPDASNASEQNEDGETELSEVSEATRRSRRSRRSSVREPDADEPNARWSEEYEDGNERSSHQSRRSSTRSSVSFREDVANGPKRGPSPTLDGTPRAGRRKSVVRSLSADPDMLLNAMIKASTVSASPPVASSTTQNDAHSRPHSRSNAIRAEDRSNAIREEVIAEAEMRLKFLFHEVRAKFCV